MFDRTFIGLNHNVFYKYMFIKEMFKAFSYLFSENNLKTLFRRTKYAFFVVPIQLHCGIFVFVNGHFS